MAKKLYVIDGHSHIYASYFAPMRGQLTSPSGEPTKATYIFTMAIVGLIRKHNPDMLVVAMDSKTPTFRHEMYAEYKAHRPPMPEDMPGQIDKIEQILDAMHIPILRVDGYEADDIIGTLAKRAGEHGYECIICSNDKDILQLINDRVSTFNLKKQTQFGIEDMRKQMGIEPRQFVDCLALQGDTSDNIPGIPDVGPKTALNWIKKYGSIENLYEHSDEIKGKRGDNLRRHRRELELGRELVTIKCDVPLDIDESQMRLGSFDKARLTSLFKELGFTRLIRQMDLDDSEPSSDANEAVDADDLPGESAAPVRPESAKTVTHEYRLVDTPEAFETFLQELKKQKRFAIDTETTSVQPMRADLVGVSFCWHERVACYLPVRAPMAAKCLDIQLVRDGLGPILADERVEKIGQNLKYDLLVLRNAHMPVRGIHFDTMVASYCLDAERRGHSLDRMALDFLGYECMPIHALIGKGKNQLTFDMVDTAAACEYAAEDADITYQLYEYLNARLQQQPQIRQLFEQVEMPLIPVLAEMEFNGVSLDTRVLREMSTQISDELESVTGAIYEHAGTVFNIDSPKQLGEVLFDKLGLTAVRVGKTGRSTDAAVLERLAAEHPIAELVLRYRALSKLRNTYVDKLGTLIHPRTSRVHASFNQTVTSTGRLSSSDPNLQNIPIRTEIGRKIRSAFVPEARDDCILSADYSQIELRLLAHFSRDAALLKAFAEDRDIHAFVASQIFDVPLDDVTDEMRSRCKAVNFGIIYGQGAFGLSRSIGISMVEARQFIEDYYARYGSIRQFMDACVEQAKKKGYAETILHRRRRIQDLYSRNANRRAQAERLAVNTVVQGSAADLIKVAMINIQNRIDAEDLPVRQILQIHDELVFELPRAQATEHAAWIEEHMTGAIEIDVPLKVDISWGSSWLSEK